jgi:hypothetical protein
MAQCLIGKIPLYCPIYELNITNLWILILYEREMNVVQRKNNIIFIKKFLISIYVITWNRFGKLFCKSFSY